MIPENSDVYHNLPIFFGSMKNKFLDVPADRPYNEGANGQIHCEKNRGNIQ